MLNPLCCNSVAFALFLHSIRDIPAQHSIRGCKAPYLRSLVRVEVVPLAYQRLALERHIWRARRKASLRSILTPQMEGLRVSTGCALRRPDRWPSETGADPGWPNAFDHVATVSCYRRHPDETPV